MHDIGSPQPGTWQRKSESEYEFNFETEGEGQGCSTLCLRGAARAPP